MLGAVVSNTREAKMIQKFFKKMRRSESGQSATEYMLIIAVVVLGLIAAASKLIPIFQGGVEKLGENISEKYLSNDPDYEKVEGL
jgi:Flp pilus assembly pilin Flp